MLYEVITDMAMRSTNPTDGKLIEIFEEMSPEETRLAVDRSAAAQLRWRETGMDERAGHLRAIARTLRGEAERLARAATFEMGKPIREARTEIVITSYSIHYTKLYDSTSSSGKPT